MYPLCRIVGSSGEALLTGKSAPLAVAHRTVGTAVTQRTYFKNRHPVACIPLTPVVSIQSTLDLLCFRMKAVSALEPVMNACGSEGGQGNTCNQVVCGRDTLDLHLGSWSVEQFPIYIYMTAGALSWLSPTH
ncbi:HTH_Tnp_Tc3_2 domain-containing protein [Trichonephila clavipes]|nr:HTH_Tnp_Tc3_2 domain-containing protein [Trichonephila clavipes]